MSLKTTGNNFYDYAIDTVSNVGRLATLVCDKPRSGGRHRARDCQRTRPLRRNFF